MILIYVKKNNEPVISLQLIHLRMDMKPVNIHFGIECWM